MSYLGQGGVPPTIKLEPFVTNEYVERSTVPLPHQPRPGLQSDLIGWLALACSSNQPSEPCKLEPDLWRQAAVLPLLSAVGDGSREQVWTQLRCGLLESLAPG
jgi:hypothetical protein